MGKSYKTCPLCEVQDTVSALNETHKALECRALEYERRVSGILSLSTRFPNSKKRHLILKDFLEGDNAPEEVLHRRTDALSTVLDGWLAKVSMLLAVVVPVTPW